MPEPERSPLGRLVLFIICLSAAGALIAGIQYFAIEQPQQNAVPPAPENTLPPCAYPHGGPYQIGQCGLYDCKKECCQTANELVYVASWCFAI